MLDDTQLSELKSGIGASECSVVLCINPYKTPYELWLEKTGRAEPEDLSDNAAVIMGSMLEPVIAHRYAQLTNQKVARVNKAIRHKEYPHILCHLDRKVMGQRKAVEIKTANPYSAEWGETGSDEIPLHYIAQVQHQLAVTGWNEADLIVFRGTTDLRIYPFKRDEELIHNIVTKLNEFWNFHVKMDVPPEAVTRGDLKLMYPENNGIYIEANNKTKEAIEFLNHHKERVNNWNKSKLRAEKQIILAIADNDGIKDGDKIIATYKANKNGVRTLRINNRG